MLPDSFTPEFLRQLELLKLRARRSFLGSRQGGHVSLKRGHGIEFSDYRKYELGDDPRHIDWGVFARSDRLYVKRFQEDQAISVLIVLDTSASMTVPAADRKWEKQLEIALTIAYVSLMQQDGVIVAAPGCLLTPELSGGRALHRFAAELSKVKPGKPCDFKRELRLALSRVRFPGVAVIISDFLMEFVDVEEILNALRSKNLDATAVQLLGPNDVNPLESRSRVIAVDSEDGSQVELKLDDFMREEYGFILAEHNERIRDFCESSRISYTLALANQDISDFVVNNLSKTGLLQ